MERNHCVRAKIDTRVYVCVVSGITIDPVSDKFEQ